MEGRARADVRGDAGRREYAIGKTYRRIFFAVYRWYRERNGPDSDPGIEAATLLLIFHSLNLMALSAILLPRNVLLSPYFRKASIPIAVGAFVFVWVLSGRAPAIETEFEDEDSLRIDRAWVVFVLYAFVSVVTCLCAFIFR